MLRVDYKSSKPGEAKNQPSVFDLSKPEGVDMLRELAKYQ